MSNFEEDSLNNKKNMQEEKKFYKNKIFAVVAAVAALAGVFAVVFLTNPGLRQKISGSRKTTEKESKTSPDISDAASYFTKIYDYKKIVLSRSEVDEQVNSSIDQTLESYVTYKKIKKGKVKSGDTVNIFYVGKIDGEAFSGGSCTKEDTPDGFDLEIGSGSFIPGFEDALIGKKIGKTVDINVTFPESYPNNPDLAGKPAVFTVTLNSKQGEKVVPKLTDEFVKENMNEYASVKEYKDSLELSISKSLALNKMVDESEVKEYPKDRLKLIKQQLNTSITYYLTQYGTTLDDYLSQMNMTKEDYTKQVNKTAEDNLKKQLVLNSVAQAENLEVTEKQYKESLETYLTTNNCEKESDLDKVFKEQFGASAKIVIYPDILEKNVSEYIEKNITIEE